MESTRVPPTWDVNLTNAESDDIAPFFPVNSQYDYLIFSSTATDVTGGKLTGNGANYHIWRARPDGSGPVAMVNDAGGDQIQPEINSAATLLVYAARVGSGPYNIYVRNLLTDNTVQITSEATFGGKVGNSLHPSWSAGGDKIVFQSSALTGSANDYDIFTIDVTGEIATLRQLTTGKTNDTDPSWSPDGRAIAFTRNARIWGMDPFGNNQIQLTNFTGSADKEPTWSPTSGSIAFASNRQGERGQAATGVGRNFNIYVLPNAQAAESASNAPYAVTIGTGNKEYPTWHHTGDRIAYSNDVNVAQRKDIWSSLLFDDTTPELMELPSVTPRLAAPGSPVAISAKVADLQSGVQSVFAQIKDPDSAKQDAEGREHKIYDPRVMGHDTQNGHRVRTWIELDCEAINPQDSTYHRPYPMDPSANKGIQLYDDGPVSKGGHEPEGQKAGDSFYTNSWTTPSSPSDFYIDLIVRDNTGNELVYDNIWGFSTLFFNPTNRILLVLDYGIGQKFIERRSSTDFSSNAFPTESYYTDNGNNLGGNNHNISPDNMTFPRQGDPVGILSSGWTDVDTLGGPLDYNIWRVQCRDPIPQAVLGNYLPSIVTEPDPSDPVNKMRPKRISNRFVVWAAPYAGDLWVGNGTITDPKTQSAIQWYLSQGGRMALSGQDVAWAVTLNGTVANPLLSNWFKVNFVDDAATDIYSSSLYGRVRHALTGAAGNNGANPISNDPIKSRHTNPQDGSDRPPRPLNLADPGWIFGNFVALWEPPGDTDVTYGNACHNQVWIDNISVAQGGVSEYTYDSGGVGGVTYSDAALGYRTAFFAFGIEGINSFIYSITLGQTQFAASDNRRNQIMHNLLGWMTTCSFQGKVTAIDPVTQKTEPIEGVIVRLTDTWHPATSGQVVGVGITDKSGNYKVVGLESGYYTFTAYRPGFTIQHIDNVGITDNRTLTYNIVLTKAQPGAITGKVTDKATTPNPIVGAKIVAKEKVFGKEYTALTVADGTYRISDVEAGEYTVTVTAEGYADPDPPSRDVTVGGNQTVTDVDFKLGPAPAEVTGKVYKLQGTTRVGLKGAQVQAYQGASAVGTAVTTDADGNYKLTGLATGTYTIKANLAGYEEGKLDIKLIGGKENKDADIEMKKLPDGSISGKIANQSGNALTNLTIQFIQGENI
ncbi:MAG: carboxypeptidase regulatory-like domain-containing protein, partial [Armatimonadetes bacterium]|nr:carboxypeptidase regulatory-like domain-containing protein [Armatimonadota bacterium]